MNYLVFLVNVICDPLLLIAVIKEKRLKKEDYPKTNNAGACVASFLVHKPGTRRSLLPIHFL